MCDFCERKVRLTKSGQYFHSTNGEIVAEGLYVDLSLGVDRNNNVCMWATGEDRTDYYYPKYCPECGRKLI